MCGIANILHKELIERQIFDGILYQCNGRLKKSDVCVCACLQLKNVLSVSLVDEKMQGECSV